MKNKRITKIIAGALIASSMIAINPAGVDAAWKKNSTGWWYTEGSGWATGWRLIDGKWYYFYGTGYMAQNESINGCYVDSNGQWVEGKLTIEEAATLVEKNKLAYGYLEDYGMSIDHYKGEIDSNSPDNRIWPTNLFEIIGYDESLYKFNYTGLTIYVGTTSGKIYFVSGGSGAIQIYKIENGRSTCIYDWNRAMKW